MRWLSTIRPCAGGTSATIQPHPGSMLQMLSTSGDHVVIDMLQSQYLKGGFSAVCGLLGCFCVTLIPEIIDTTQYTSNVFGSLN